jgi:phosphatidylglycerophosphate synthase
MLGCAVGAFHLQLWWIFVICRIGLMSYIRGWRIRSQAGEEIRMHFMQPVCTLLVAKRTSHELLRVHFKDFSFERVLLPLDIALT